MAKSKKHLPPNHLTPTEKTAWNQYAGDVNLDDRYLYDTLAVYCQLLSTIAEATQSIKEDLIVETPTSFKANPAVQIRSQTQTQCNRLAKILFRPQKDSGHIQDEELTKFFED